MSPPILAVVVDNLSNLGLDLLLFIAVEMVTRLVVVRPRQNGGQDYPYKLLLFQASALLGMSLLLTAYHHLPYLLLLFLVGIVIRLVFVAVNQISRTDSRVVSIPLQYIASELEDVDPFPTPLEQCAMPVRRPLAQQPRGLGEPMYRSELTPPHGMAGRGTYGPQMQPLWPKFTSPTVATNRKVYHAESSASTRYTATLAVPNGKASHIQLLSAARKNGGVSPRKLGSVANPPTAHSRLVPSLQRSPITSVHRPLSPPQPSAASTLRQSLFCRGPQSLGYFGTWFNTHSVSLTPPGILNAGNTCFVNSILQCLTWTAGFLAVVPSDITGIDVADVLLHNLLGVLQKCHALPDGETHFGPVNASGLLDSLSQSAPHLVVAREGDQYQTQQDAAEFLLWLLDYLHEFLRQRDSTSSTPLSPEELSMLSQKREAYLLKLEEANSNVISSFCSIFIELSELDWQLSRNRGSSKIYELFMGQLVEARECQQCRKMSVNLEYFTVLPIPLPPQGTGLSYTLEDCFNLFREVEDLVEANRLRCPCVVTQSRGSEASLTPWKRRALLSRAPSKLVIQLTRFSYDSTRNLALKSSVPIAFPLTFDLHPQTMDAILEGEKRELCYQLYAFCTHSGAQSTSYGHYMAYCKATDGRWYCFNDGYVTYIADINATLVSAFVLQNAYLLFYTSQRAGADS